MKPPPRYSPGSAFGILLGGRLNQQFSLNGEIGFDISNIEGVPAGAGASPSSGHRLALSPLDARAGRRGRVVFGPKLGFFVICVGVMAAYQRDVS